MRPAPNPLGSGGLQNRRKWPIKTVESAICEKGVTAVVEAVMGMQTAQIQSAYSTALMKRTMDDAESQALSLINDMVASVPAPAQYTFDVRA